MFVEPSIGRNRLRRSRMGRRSFPEAPCPTISPLRGESRWSLSSTNIQPRRGCRTPEGFNVCRTQHRTEPTPEESYGPSVIPRHRIQHFTTLGSESVVAESYKHSTTPWLP